MSVFDLVCDSAGFSGIGVGVGLGVSTLISVLSVCLSGSGTCFGFISAIGGIFIFNFCLLIIYFALQLTHSEFYYFLYFVFLI